MQILAREVCSILLRAAARGLHLLLAGLRASMRCPSLVAGLPADSEEATGRCHCRPGLHLDCGHGRLHQVRSRSRATLSPHKVCHSNSETLATVVNDVIAQPSRGQGLAHAHHACYCRRLTGRRVQIDKIEQTGLLLRSGASFSAPAWMRAGTVTSASCGAARAARRRS